MKKITAVILVLAMILSIGACAKKEAAQPATEAAPEPAPEVVLHYSVNFEETNWDPAYWTAPDDTGLGSVIYEPLFEYQTDGSLKPALALSCDISGDNPAKREEHLEVIIAETNRLDELVGDILTLSKMQAGVLEMEKTDFDLQEAAESVFNTYKVMENEGFTFSFKKVDGPVIVHADRHRIQQVIANLLSNAIRYSRDTKEVSLDFSLENGRVRCSVSDKGIGIDEEDLQPIWNRYQKAV